MKKKLNIGQKSSTMTQSPMASSQQRISISGGGPMSPIAAKPEPVHSQPALSSEASFKLKSILSHATQDTIPQKHKLFGYADYLGEGVRSATFQVCSENLEVILIPKASVLRVIKYLYSILIEDKLMELQEEFYFFADWNKGIFR